MIVKEIIMSRNEEGFLTIGKLLTNNERNFYILIKMHKFYLLFLLTVSTLMIGQKQKKMCAAA